MSWISYHTRAFTLESNNYWKIRENIKHLHLNTRGIYRNIFAYQSDSNILFLDLLSKYSSISKFITRYRDTFYLPSNFKEVQKIYKLTTNQINNLILTVATADHRYNLLKNYRLYPQKEYLLNMRDLVEVNSVADIEKLQKKLLNDSIYVNCEGLVQSAEELPSCETTVYKIYADTGMVNHTRRLKDCILQSGILKELEQVVTNSSKEIYYTQPDFQFYIIQNTDTSYMLTRPIQRIYCFIDGYYGETSW